MALGSWYVLTCQIRRLSSSACRQLCCGVRSLLRTVLHRYQLGVASMHPFWLLLVYFVVNSFLGFLSLKSLHQKQGVVGTRNLDLFFMSVSAATVSSMSTTQMEVFSRGQIFLLILLMFAGGEVFTSLLRLHLMKSQIMVERRKALGESEIDRVVVSSTALGLPITAPQDEMETQSDRELRCKSINLLSAAVSGYLVGAISLGSAAFIVYFASSSASGARETLRKKGIHVLDFSVFLSVSSFTNCGFVLTNENMLPFRKNSSLLLMIIPLVLAGNILFPPCLRSLLWCLRSLVGGRREAIDDLLGRTNGRQLGFNHLFEKRRCFQIVYTTIALISLQIIVLMCMEWDSDVLRVGDMSAWQKMVAVLFQSVNSRHAGESVFDLSVLSPAVLMVYVVMMYLPPYTSFSPGEDKADALSGLQRGRWRRQHHVLSETLILPHLGYISIFVIVVCVTERRKLAQDPLNFNVFSIAFEVISAYANVGLSMGYSCGRQLTSDEGCKDQWYGFAGWWSDGGKIILICVMIIGRLRRFNKSGGSAWKLS